MNVLGSVPEPSWGRILSPGTELAAKIIHTQTSLDAVRPGSKRQEMRDGKVAALRLIVQPSGKMSWSARYSILGEDRRLTIGPYPGIGLADARKRAIAAVGQVASGSDPAAEKAEAEKAAKDALKAGPADAELVESVVAEFIARYAKPNLRSWPELQRKFERDVIPLWGGRRLADIGKADVHRVLDRINDRGSAVSANRTFAAVRKLCRWAVERGIIDRNPTEGLRRPTKERTRDRVLSSAELALVWKAADRITATYAQVIRVLILTGQRRDEVGGMRWDEIDLATKTWAIPAGRVKNSRAHAVPLSDPVIAIIKAQPRVSDLVFSVGKAPSSWSRAKRHLDDLVAELNDGELISPFVIHDIRRSVASGMARIGVAPHVVEKLLNHTSGTFGGVTGVYQRHSYADEVKAALAAWAVEIERVVGKGRDHG